MNSIAEMRDAVFFAGAERGTRLQRFWILLILSSVIAAAGVAADSTATVIGAMIIAPLMLPIQGAMLATVLGDRLNLLRSISLILAGMSASIAIGYVVGLMVPQDIVAATNSQVAGRVTPRLIDLLAALATGVAGSIALVRRDISDTLPGVAIAISLVPPLTVTGLTIESASYGQAVGALWLFATNVASILATGIVVMSVYRVRDRSSDTGATPQKSTRRSTAVLVIMLAVITVPLAVSSISTARSEHDLSTIRALSENWATEAGWHVVDVEVEKPRIVIQVSGEAPEPRTASLARDLAASGLDFDTVSIEFIPIERIELEATT
ncbi:membrane protein [Leucobacter sp. Psy1]|uniref:TIGR00341 family protein n=1 Tax=Leucobacter sp. Psy1 TaxID=2875729 RepID=UPI001CD3D7A1|nr:TIGR00341 family protein [Leucobacter sp. Psy1]UBH05360.1 membrane protein [Leucobacter sp. Psy1]